jgi:sugar/nucleoside kinase (ribokinase family)
VAKKTGKIEAIVAGHICLDITPAIPFDAKAPVRPIQEIFTPGKLINTHGVTLSTGGAVSNTGMALVTLGVPTQLMGKIGDDFFGQGVLGILEGRGVRGGMTIVKGEQTSYSVVLVPPGHDRIFLHDPGANDTFTAADINYDLVAQARLFHFGYPTLMKRFYENDGRELVKILKRVKALGVTTSLDMTVPDASSPSGKANWEKILRDALPYVDLFTPSVEETLYMAHRSEFNRLAGQAQGREMIAVLDLNVLPEVGERLLEWGTRAAFIKCGVKGCYLRTRPAAKLKGMGRAEPPDLANWGDRELLEEAFQVKEVASTTGAGDACIGGFLAALLRGMGVEDCLRTGCAVGAQSVQAVDTFSGIRPFQETLALLKKRPQKLRVEIPGSYWSYDAVRCVWRGKNDTAR